MFVIQLEQIDGVELILKALRETPCIASHQLADGIEAHLIYVDEDGNGYKVEDTTPTSKKPSLKLVH